LKQYRVQKTTKVGSDLASEDLVWSGTDTDELSRKFPPSQIWGADPLGRSEIDDGHIIFDHLFECSEDEGQTWQTCKDPRRRITPVTDLEREIDAENRSRFPGDYIEHEDDEPWDDQWGDEPSLDSEYDEPSLDSQYDEYEDYDSPT